MLLATLDRKMHARETEVFDDEDEKVDKMCNDEDEAESNSSPHTVAAAPTQNDSQAKSKEETSQETKKYRIPTKEETKLRMNLPSAAALAAAPPTALPTCRNPSLARPSIGKVQCGSMRLLVVSTVMHVLLLTFIHIFVNNRRLSLNKGGLPSYVEQFIVSKGRIWLLITDPLQFQMGTSIFIEIKATTISSTRRRSLNSHQVTQGQKLWMKNMGTQPWRL